MPEEFQENKLPNLEGALSKDDKDTVFSVDAAEWFEHADKNEQLIFIKQATEKKLALLFKHIYEDDISFILKNLSKSRKKKLLSLLPDDVLTDILQSRDDDELNELLKLLSAKKKNLAKRLLKYSENSAGGRMTTQIIKLSENMSVLDAINFVKDMRESTEILSRLYVVDNQDRILGKVRLRDIAFIEDRNIKINEIMMSEAIAINANADQEEAANLIQKYGMLALPVINDKNQILGIITYDDAMEILRMESTEDIEKIAAIGGKADHLHYLDTPIFRHFQRRVFWVIALAFLAIFSGLVLYKFENVLNSCFLLALYLPMIVASGGNTGGQAATMVIRAMSLEEFEPKKFILVIWKEIRIGLLLGLVVALLIALQITFFPISDTNFQINKIAWIVSIALLVQITSSTFAGAALPIFAKSLRLDPAVVASPAITTLVDVSGLFIYFLLAKYILNI